MEAEKRDPGKQVDETGCSKCALMEKLLNIVKSRFAAVLRVLALHPNGQSWTPGLNITRVDCVRSTVLREVFL